MEYYVKLLYRDDIFIDNWNISGLNDNDVIALVGGQLRKLFDGTISDDYDYLIKTRIPKVVPEKVDYIHGRSITSIEDYLNMPLFITVQEMCYKNGTFVSSEKAIEHAEKKIISISHDIVYFVRKKLDQFIEKGYVIDNDIEVIYYEFNCSLRKKL